MNYFAKAALLCAFLLITSCEFYAQDEYEEQYVVESYLVANRLLPHVRISHTLPVEEEYSFSETAVSNAIIEIRLLDNNGEPEETHDYFLESNGIYAPADPAMVLPGRRYELRVTFPQSSDEITAQTLVPGSFGIDDDVDDSIPYQSDEQLEINITKSNQPASNDRQIFFIFTVNATNPDPDNLTPFYESLVDEQDDDISSFRVNSSGIVNEENYKENPDGSMTLRLPWIAVAFYEENDIIANAIDDNMYDFLRYQNVQGGGSTLPPGEIQNIKYNVEGGIGVFGSMASDTVRVYINRQ